MYVLCYQKNDETEYKTYGFGDLTYIMELINDFVLHCKMYGNSSVTFKIIKDEVK